MQTAKYKDISDMAQQNQIFITYSPNRAVGTKVNSRAKPLNVNRDNMGSRTFPNIRAN